jgi:hypothetical protein
VSERAHDAEPVGEHDHADHALLARERRHYRVGDAPCLEVALQPRAAERGVDRNRAAAAALEQLRIATAPSESTGSISSRWLAGPTSVRSDGFSSEPNKMISASSARNASSERMSSPSSASAISDDRASVRLASYRNWSRLWRSRSDR